MPPTHHTPLLASSPPQETYTTIKPPLRIIVPPYNGPIPIEVINRSTFGAALDVISGLDATDETFSYERYEGEAHTCMGRAECGYCLEEGNAYSDEEDEDEFGTGRRETRTIFRAILTVLVRIVVFVLFFWALMGLFLMVEMAAQ